MKSGNVRVLLVSEQPKIRTLLKDMVESEEKVDVIGQAEEIAMALDLARDLKPDVAIIDNYLPRAGGLDEAPPSGLDAVDAAATICGAMPDVRVVLLNRRENTILSGKWKTNIRTFFCRETGETCIPFTIVKLRDMVEPAGAPITARIEAATNRSLRYHTVKNLSDRAILFGVLGVLVGWFLTISLWLFPPAAVIALAGVALVLAGLAGKVFARIIR